MSTSAYPELQRFQSNKPNCFYESRDPRGSHKNNWVLGNWKSL